ncbi:MAG: prepilin-type N-terminal cleavage/methylation domain-containing protein [Opitutaceae bacterium]|jgi:general secretion pathway protein G|nr:prepilin-type N-terminal cleavage/methylation domain-containing protein [Opitutaceae bacterium]
MKRKIPASETAAAFTLIELLTVITIIGILAGILIPVVASVRKSARNATCISNLRQLHTAVALYAADNKDNLPTGWLAVAQNSGPWTYKLTGYMQDGSKNYINASITAIKKGEKSILFCDQNASQLANPATSSASSNYGWNHYGLLNKKMNGSDHASRLCMTGETEINAARTDWSILLYSSSVVKLVPNIHGSHSNVLYLDGHVGSIKEVPPQSDTTFWEY